MIDSSTSRTISLSSGIVLSASVILWALGILESEINFVPYGLSSSVPLIWWIGLLGVVLIFFLSFKFRLRSVMIASLGIGLMYAYVTPYAIAGTPRRYMSFPFFGQVDSIVRTGHIDPSNPVLFYHNWPGFPIWSAAIEMIGAIDAIGLMIGEALLLSFLVVMAVYLVSRRILGPSTAAVVGTWIFLFGNWFDVNTFAPQILGFVLAILVIYSTLPRGLNRPRNKAKRTFVVILLYLSLTLTHLLSAFVVLMFFVFKRVLTEFGRRNFKVFGSFTTQMRVAREEHATALTLGVIFLGWIIYGAATQFEFRMIHFVTELLTFELVRFTPSSAEAFQMALTTRLAIVILLILAGAAGAATIFHRSKADSLVVIYPLLIGISAIPLFIMRYGNEIRSRVFFFASVAAAILISLPAKKGRFVLVAVLMLSLPFLHFPAHYGEETLNYVPPAEVSGARFFFSHSAGGATILGTGASPWLWEVRDNDLVQMPNSTVELARLFANRTPLFIWMNDGSRRWFESEAFHVQLRLEYSNTYYADLTAKFDKVEKLSKIYSNGATDFWISGG